MRRTSAQLLDKAISSLRRAIGAFNSPDDDGRRTTVLLHLQHSAEMMLKAGLTERRVKVLDRRTGRSIGFEKCLSLAQQHLGVTADEAGLLRTIDSLRDDEQHWLATVSEELLFLHARAAIGAIDGVMERVFSRRLADRLPSRALPITTRPLEDFDVLVDRQYSQVADLLQTGRRRRSTARALIRGMLAMEGHATEDSRVSEADVNRVERGIRDGKSLAEVFPRLTSVTATAQVNGPTINVRFSKKRGAPVQFVPADDPTEAAAVREVDLQRKYHWSATQLAEKLGLTNPRATALRRALRIDEDPGCVHQFTFGNLKVIQYSDNAYTRMRDALADPAVDMETVWAEHRPRRRQ